MRNETFTFSPDGKWSVAPFPDLDGERTLVLAFGASRFGGASEPLTELRRAYPRSHVVGCSTSGEITDDVVRDDTIAVSVTRFDQSTLRTVYAAVASADASFGAGATLARELVGADLRAVLVLSDGLNVNGSELVKGLNSVLPKEVVVAGGLAGDGDRFQKTWVLGRDGPQSHLVSAVGIYGARVRVGHGSRGGWDRFGPERNITRSAGNVLYELDDRPALALYKEYLGERAAGLPATALLFPLAVRSSSVDPKVLVRTILGVDEAKQSMTFAGDVPQGFLAQLMRANFERLIDGAAMAAILTKDPAGDATGDVLAVAISCVGRRLILGERTEEELEAALDALPERTRQIGFYSYGEISPYATGKCDLHNQTMTLTNIEER
jgi:hypothetical protein